jgi:hypothetical protein
MDENGIKTTRIVGKKSLLIFFIGFVIVYYLLTLAYIEVLRLKFSDLVMQISYSYYGKISMERLYKFLWWRALEPVVLLIILCLTCVYTRIFKRNYFKESIIAFLLFIVALSAFGFLNKAYTKKQEKDDLIRNKSLIIGKWSYTNRVAGNVTLEFNKDSTGYRFADSNKTIQKFRYHIMRGSSLAINFHLELNKDEFYHIDLLTTKTLNISSGPFTKIKNNVYNSKFKRDAP